MIVGRNPRKPVVGDTVLLWADKRRGVGTIVDTDAIRYKVYWRNGKGHLSWHTRGELIVPRLDYDLALSVDSMVKEAPEVEGEISSGRQGAGRCSRRHDHGRRHRPHPGQVG
jgi:hypothetical protein